MNLDKKTALWTNEKIITVQQRQAILDYESYSGHGWAMKSVVGLALFCIGLGLISLIAANWDVIPAPVKLGGDFLLLALVLGGAFKAYMKENNVWYDSLLFLGFMMCGATIGLGAQIFNLHSTFSEGLLFWAVASFPLVLSSRGRFLGFIWIPLFLMGIMDDHRWHQIELFYRYEPVMATFMISIVLGALGWFAPLVKSGFIKALGVWAWILFYVSLMLGDYFFTRQTHHVLSGFALTMIFLGVLAVLDVKSVRRRAFQWNTFLMGIRILVLYFEVFISLAVTGVGLMISGLVILGVTGLWQYLKRYYDPLLKGESK